MQKVVILGSTGSLGIQTLEVLEKYKKHFEVIGLSANVNKSLLEKQAKKWKVKKIILASATATSKLIELAATKEADIIINVLSGVSGIGPSIAALKAGKILLLGNKESLFVEGKKIMKLAAAQKLIPLDSEHNAIFEILKKFPHEKIEKIIIPCSGGPFYGKSKKFLAKVSAAEALKHPRYKMGKKISIESASLLNKGFEVIEAHHLFGLPLGKIATAFHPECEIHGAVKFKNNDYPVAYFSKPDMREHLENALLRSAGLPLKNLKIKILKSARLVLKPLRPGALKGLDLTLKVFKKSKNSPKLLKRFLLREEKLILKFLQNKINFLKLFKL